MSVETFKLLIASLDPQEMVYECLYRKFVYAIPNESEYASYLNFVRADYPCAELVSIMGSGNWGYSLNPEKSFRPFGIESDIDLVLVCGESFYSTWEELRSYHREKYYQLDYAKRTMLKRNGENVYSGFITPKWIFNKVSQNRFRYEVNSNKYSNDKVAYRKVNMMYFKNTQEAIDYYVRGFRLAKGALKNGL